MRYIFALMLCCLVSSSASAQTQHTNVNQSLSQWSQYVAVGANTTTNVVQIAPGQTVTLQNGMTGAASTGLLAPTVGQSGPIRIDLTGFSHSLGDVVTAGWNWSIGSVFRVIFVLMGLSVAAGLVKHKIDSSAA